MIGVYLVPVHRCTAEPGTAYNSRIYLNNKDKVLNLVPYTSRNNFGNK